MTMMIWDTSIEDSIISRFDEHTEFVLGIDFNIFVEKLVATTSWDETVRIGKYQEGQQGTRNNNNVNTQIAAQ